MNKHKMQKRSDANKENGPGVLFRLLKFARGMEGWMLLAILAGTAGFFTAAGIPVTAALSALSHRGSSLYLSFQSAALIMGAFALLRGMLRYLEQACNHYIAFRLLAKIRDQVFKKLRELGPAKLDGKSKGDLIALITSDVELLEVFYAHTISPVCIALCSAIIYIAIGMSMHAFIGLFLLFSYLCVGILIPLLFSSKASMAGSLRRKAHGDLNSVVLENVNGIEEILQYNRKDVRKALMNEKTNALLDQEEALQKQTIRVSQTTTAIVTLCTLGMAVLVIALSHMGRLSSQFALGAVVMQASTFGPFIALANLSTGLAQTQGAARRVLALLDEKPLVDPIENGLCPARTETNEMETKNLSFGYGGHNVLSDLSVAFQTGKITGIEGKSGCGKSTLLRLLMRFFDPDRGEVMMQGQDLCRLETAHLQNSQSAVLQETVLFSGTLRDNLLMVCPQADETEIREALRKANLLEWVDSLPDGLNTRIGAQASQLSSGERQRLGLARAFLHDAPMMLLDEPTSNLDSLNEGAILRALHTEAKDKTVILVSHRKGSLSFADSIIKMEELYASGT